MKYNKRVLDLEKLSVTQSKYRDGLTAVLRACGWNVTQAGKKVGLSRSSMYRRLHILSIKIPITVPRGGSIFDHEIPKEEKLRGGKK